MSITYRQANEADQAVLGHCLQQIVSAERPMDECLKPSHIEYYDPMDFVKQADRELLVAECNKRVIACGAAKIVDAKDYYQYSKQLYLNMMYVHPNYRGRGINSEIINRLMAWGRDQGVENAVLTVYPENPSAIRAYEKLGFESALIEMRFRAYKKSDSTQ